MGALFVVDSMYSRKNDFESTIPNGLHGLKIANIKKKLSLIFTDQLRNIELSYKGRNNLLK